MAGSGPAASASTPLSDLPGQKDGEERKTRKAEELFYCCGVGDAQTLTVAGNKLNILSSTRARRQQEKCVILCLVWQGEGKMSFKV